MLSVPMNIYTGKETCKECGCLLEKVKIQPLSNWGKDDEGVIEERKFALFYFFAELEDKGLSTAPHW